MLHAVAECTGGVRARQAGGLNLKRYEKWNAVPGGGACIGRQIGVICQRLKGMGGGRGGGGGGGIRAGALLGQAGSGL